MSQPVVLIVELWIAPERRAEFENFEAAAAEIMASHGGRIERRLAMRQEAVANPPDEVHIVTFASREAYESYRGDPALVPLAEQRARAIQRTVIREGADMPPFGA
ncbi:MAG: DUF1330 domain-containing protein [Longimicrobiales bacterium]